MKRLIKNQVTDRVVMIGDWIPLRTARAPVTAVNYNYVNASRVPAHGEITTTALQLRINNVDSDGVDHGAYLSHVKIGDTVTINGQSATITTDPIWTSSGYWYFDVDAWPFMADGNYEVTIIYAVPSTFSPANLFTSGEQGAWYDPSDLTTMFQDRAGTTPVTADGQTVGKILDKSGRGNPAVAPSDAARPLYKTDGTYHWIQFDGVDDYLKAAAFSNPQPLTYCIGVKPNSWVTNRYFYDGNSVDNVMICQLNGNNLAKAYAGVLPPTEVTIPVGAGSVVTNIYNGASSKTRVNASDAFSGNLGTLTASGLTLGSNGNGTGWINAEFSSIIFRGALSTTQEITDTETWVNSKTGAY